MEVAEVVAVPTQPFPTPEVVRNMVEAVEDAAGDCLQTMRSTRVPLVVVRDRTHQALVALVEVLVPEQRELMPEPHGFPAVEAVAAVGFLHLLELPAAMAVLLEVARVVALAALIRAVLAVLAVLVR